MELEEIVPVLTANPPKRLEEDDQISEITEDIDADLVFLDEHSAITQIY